MSRFVRRSLVLGGIVVALWAGGTVGFLQYPGWSLSDAAFMSWITITAVGYDEVHPLTDGGRILTSFLLVGGITSMGLWFALLTSSIVEMDLAHVFRKRRIMKELRSLRDHVIVCGAGRTGRQVISELRNARKPYVVIERDPERAEQIRQSDPRAVVIEADSTRDEALVEARIDTASGLIAALSTDTDNLYLCVGARSLRPDLTIVSRGYEEETMSKLYKAGANHVVSPNVTGGIRMASVLLRPQVVSFLDVVTQGDGLDLRLEQVKVPADSPLARQTLAEARIPQKTGLIVIAVRHGAEREAGDDGPLAYNPGPDEEIRPDDALIVLGRPEQIDRLRAAVGG